VISVVSAFRWTRRGTCHPAAMITKSPGHLKGFTYFGLHRYSLTFCTAERRRVFTDAAAVELVVQQLVRAAREHKFSVIAYCFMPDHLQSVQAVFGLLLLAEVSRHAVATIRVRARSSRRRNNGGGCQIHSRESCSRRPHGQHRRVSVRRIADLRVEGFDQQYVQLKLDTTGTVRLKPDATGTVRLKPDATGVGP